MFKEFLKNPRALIYAVLIHVVLLLVLVMSLKWNTKPAPLQGSGDIIKAVVIDESKLEAQKERQRQEEQRQRAAEEAQRQAAEQQRQDALHKQQAEAQRQREAQRAAEKKRQLMAEQQRQAKLKADKDAKDRQRMVEQRRQAELQAKRKADEAKRQAEAQRQADETRRQRENLEMMKQQMAQEEADRVAQAKAEQQQRELAAKMNQYSLLLNNIMKRNWIRPSTARAGLTCTVHVSLFPGGDVRDAYVTKSSGDAAFDRSAETAVYRSSPLPMPPDPSVREFNLNFHPEG